MIKRYKYIVSIGNDNYEVNPIGIDKLRKSLDKSSTGNFYKEKLSGKMTFIEADYKILRDIEVSADRCREIFFKVQKNCSGVWTDDYRGTLSLNDGEWFLDMGRVEIESDTIDLYLKYEEKKDEDINLIEKVIHKAFVGVYDNGMPLFRILEYFAVNICGYVSIRSDFFQINPSFATVNNYVTGQPHTVNHLIFYQKADVRRPTNSDNSSKCFITFEKLLKLLNVMFNVKWWIDENEIFRIEHISYQGDDIAGGMIDLTQAKWSKWMQATGRYTYNKGEMPKYEDFKFMEASGIDFMDRSIYYESVCVTATGDNARKLYQAEEMTTDFDYIFLHQDADDKTISDAGFVMLACTKLGDGSYQLRQDIGALSGATKNNAALSWANLHRDFHKHGRVLTRGIMNNILTDFDPLTVVFSKKQKTFSIPWFCEVFNPFNTVRTSLGEGTIDKAVYNYRTQMLDLDLIYPGDAELVETFPPVAENSIASLLQDGEITIDLADYVIDADGFIFWPSLNIIFVNNGDITVIGNGLVKYKPNIGYFGNALIYWKVQDNSQKWSNNAYVNITVAQKPVVLGDRFTAIKNQLLSRIDNEPSLFVNDTSAGVLGLESFDNPSLMDGEVDVTANGHFTYLPPINFTGQDKFMYRVKEQGTNLEADGPVLIDVINAKTTAHLTKTERTIDTWFGSFNEVAEAKRQTISITFPINVYNAKVRLFKKEIDGITGMAWSTEEVFVYVNAVAGQPLVIMDDYPFWDAYYKNTPLGDEKLESNADYINIIDFELLSGEIYDL